MTVARAIRGSTAGRVLIVDNLSRMGAHENARWLLQTHPRRIAIERADTRDAEAMNTLVRGVDGVMNLAAQVAVTKSIEDPIEDFEVNARGTLNVLEAVRRYNVRAAVIFASTNKVYGALLEPGSFRRVDDRYVPNEAPLSCGVG